MKILKALFLSILIATGTLFAKGNTKWGNELISHDKLLQRFDTETDFAKRWELLRQMYAVCRKHPENKLIYLRTKIEEAQYYGRINPETEKYFDAVDSARHEYEFMRIKAVRVTDMSDYDFNKYRLSCELRDYFHRIGDTIMEANIYNSIATMLDYLDEKGQAFRLYKKAGELYRHAGFKGAYQRNLLNIANQYYYQGKRNAACNVIRNIEKDRSVRTDTMFMIRLYMSLYTYSPYNAERNRASRRALELASRSGSQRLVLMCKANRGEYYLNGEEGDSAYHYLKDCFRNRNELGDFKAVYEADMMATNLFEKMGLTDSAYVYLKHGVAMRDSIDKAAVANKIRQQETLTEIGKYEAKLAQVAKNKKRNEAILAVFIIIILIISVSFCTLLYIKWRKKHLEAMLKTKENNLLSTEIKSRERELTTSAMMIEESHTALKSVKQVLEKRRNGEISQSDIQELANIFNSYTDSANDWEVFKSHFNNVHPELLNRLKDRFPSLTDSDLKLCAFLFLGLETKHIAKILSVQPDSVKKARQRLRRKLGIHDRSTRVQDLMRGL